MRIVRFQIPDSKKPKYGWLLDDKVGEISGNIFGRYQRKEALTPLSDVKLVHPSEPTKIICVGRNYVEHAKELGNEVPKVPLIFSSRPPRSFQTARRSSCRRNQPRLSMKRSWSSSSGNADATSQPRMPRKSFWATPSAMM